ncbi:HD-GYP domain-containing protein [Gorillibacterium timonense]|uniref:HD-GYP domain-containing protein n=1 Tax=Gorillibacterium timonense TaxID=1689269 RepID=UPI00071D940B|nr:HD-GYP domain-containing protein [Gorillibacterium timonense]
MKVHVMDVETGDVILADVFNRYGLLVLSSGTILDGDAVSRLLQHQLEYVDVLPKKSAATAPQTTLPYNPQKTRETMQVAVHSAKALYDTAQDTGLIDADLAEGGFLSMAESVRGNHDVASMLLVLNQKDDYAYRHCVQVGLISYHLAKWLGKPEAECCSIGTAGYLHDIGKTKIPKEILGKPGPLTLEEFETIKKHTVYGFSMIADSIGNPDWALPALQHHERLDGSGYPHGIRGSEIHPASKVVAIADIYSAMISTTPYRKGKDLMNVLCELHSLSFGKLDPHMTQVFIRNMLPNLIGKSVVLSSGETGTIVMTNPSDFFRPLVKVDDQFLDLAQMPLVSISRFVEEATA